MLDCAAWGTAPADLAFLDPPPAGALAAATALLIELGALDADRPHHRRRPAHGAARRASAAGGDDAGGRAPRPRRRSPPISPPCWRSATRCAAPTRRPISALRLAAIADGDPAADRGALSRIRRAAGQYRRRLRLPTHAAEGDPGRLLAAAFPDRIAQRRGEPGSFRLSGGGGARLPRTDPLASAPLLAVAALELKAAARIRLAAPLDPDTLPGRSRASPSRWRPASIRCPARCWHGAVAGSGALVLTDRTEPADPAEVAAALARAVAAEGCGRCPGPMRRGSCRRGSR